MIDAVERKKYEENFRRHHAKIGLPSDAIGRVVRCPNSGLLYTVVGLHGSRSRDVIIEDIRDGAISRIPNRTALEWLSIKEERLAPLRPATPREIVIPINGAIW